MKFPGDYFNQYWKECMVMDMLLNTNKKKFFLRVLHLLRIQLAPRNDFYSSPL